MLLFSYVLEWTEIKAAIISRDMKNSSILERLVQVLQVLQIRKLRNLYTWFTLPVNGTSHVRHAMQAGRWTCTMHNDHPKCWMVAGETKGLFVGKYTFVMAWMKHYSTISLDDPKRPVRGNPCTLEFILRDTLKALTSFPFNHDQNH